MPKFAMVVADALASSTHTIAHGCNRQGRMGRGFAGQLKRLYPGAYDAYMARYRERGLRLGEIVSWKGRDRAILNCITQDRYGADGVKRVDEEAVRACMREIDRVARAHLSRGEGLFHDQPVIGMPRIGAGLAGGEWAVVESIIREEISSIDVVVYVWPPES